MLEIAGLVLLVLVTFSTIGALLRRVDHLEGEVSHLRDVCRYLAERRGPA